MFLVGVIYYPVATPYLVYGRIKDGRITVHLMLISRNLSDQHREHCHSHVYLHIQAAETCTNPQEGG